MVGGLGRFLVIFVSFNLFWGFSRYFVGIFLALFIV